MTGTTVQTWLANPAVQTLLIVAAGYPLGRLIDAVGLRLVAKMVAKTRTTYDDKILGLLRKPIRRSAVLAALWVAIDHNQPPDAIGFFARGLVASWTLVIWTRTLFRLARLVIEWLANIENRFAAVTVRTVPAWTMAAHLLLATVAAYFFFLCWNFDVTGWLASAGIIGVAVGFGAKDTMANLFAGVGILADKPYRIGDFLLLDTGERGRVTDIGLRSTRLMTQDEMEIIVPNATMATTTIINESGGPQEAERLRIPLRVAYGTDVDRVRALLLEVAGRTEGVLKNDSSRSADVHFTAMGDYGLDFELLCFIELPEHKFAVIDRLNSAIYKATLADGIEIPFPQQIVHLASDTHSGQ